MGKAIQERGWNNAVGRDTVQYVDIIYCYNVVLQYRELVVTGIPEIRSTMRPGQGLGICVSGVNSGQGLVPRATFNENV